MLVVWIPLQPSYDLDRLNIIAAEMSWPLRGFCVKLFLCCRVSAEMDQGSRPLLQEGRAFPHQQRVSVHGCVALYRTDRRQWLADTSTSTNRMPMTEAHSKLTQNRPKSPASVRCTSRTTA